MKHFAIKYLGLFICCAMFTALYAQPKYRTFNQVNLAEKKAKAGKVLSSNVCFTFNNDSTGITVNSLHFRLNSEVKSIIDSGGYTTFDIKKHGKVIVATGRSVVAGASVTLCFNLDKKTPGAHANFWWWDTNGVQVGNKRSELAGTYQPIQIQPNGGTVREYIYKHLVPRPQGLFVGIKTDTLGVGWIRYKTADRNYFPHTNPARCFDLISTGSIITRPFNHELKNPHVKKHNNHLLGEVHALKLAIIANDSGATQPLDTTALGDLIYNDLTNPSDPGNSLTLRKLVALIDSALTYCDHFDLVPGIYTKLDTCVSRINRAFDGAYTAVSFNPFVLAGTHMVEEIPFLHPNPAAAPVMRHGYGYSIVDQTPETFSLEQNYPNPFNPTTTIDFNLIEPSIVSLKVYNLLGQEVASLLVNEMMDDGMQSIEFNANNLTSGVYFYKVVAQGVGEMKQQYQEIKRMMLIK
jgi:hypothetical protein